MIKPIKIIEIMCQQTGHEDQLVSSLCIRSQCKKNSACCPKCLDQSHQKCLNQITVDVPQLVGSIQNLEKLYEDLVSAVGMVLNQIKEALANLIRPIKEYQSVPNLQNLSLLGNLLRLNPSLEITQQIKQSQEVFGDQLIQLLKTIESFLGQQYNTRQLEPRQDKDEARQWLEEFQKYCDKDQQKALKCIEKVIELEPNNEDYWYRKSNLIVKVGQCLLNQNRYDDSIQSFNKSIEIKPTGNAYWSKAIALQCQNKQYEALGCCVEGLRLFPNHSNLKYYLNSLKQIIKSNEANQFEL